MVITNPCMPRTAKREYVAYLTKKAKAHVRVFGVFLVISISRIISNTAARIFDPNYKGR